jgi:plastocyanin
MTLEEGILRTSALFVIAVCLCAADTGCSKTKKPGSDKTTAGTTDAPLAPATKSEKAVSKTQTGAITGRVVFTGIKPEPANLPGTADPGCLGRSAKSDEVVVNPNGTLRDVLVRVAPGSIKTAASVAEPVVLDQKDCTYSPKVAGALVGATLRIHNSDRTAHDARIVKGDKTLLTRSLPAGVPDLSEANLTTEPGLLKIECTTHPWMAGFVVVTDNPYFQTTGADGTFNLDGLPPGRYSIEAWHPKYATRSASLQVEAGQATDVAFGFDNTVPR